MSRSVYLDGRMYVVVETGMPEYHVQIGFGESIDEAVESLEDTAIQSTGPDMGRASALAWAHSEGWIRSRANLIRLEDDGTVAY